MKWAAGAALAAVALLGVFMTKRDSAPRGIRNNNPLNIRVGNNWQGEVQNTDGEFEQFESVVMGIRAAAKLLKTYRDKYGFNTIEQIITRWAPPEENNTAAYIKSVEARTGIARDRQLATDDYKALISAMIFHENGAQPYTIADIDAGFNKGFYA
jgi:hypothetical protein